MHNTWDVFIEELFNIENIVFKIYNKGRGNMEYLTPWNIFTASKLNFIPYLSLISPSIFLSLSSFSLSPLSIFLSLFLPPSLSLSPYFLSISDLFFSLSLSLWKIILTLTPTANYRERGFWKSSLLSLYFGVA